MDPATLALIGIAALAATTIKRGVRPPAPAPSPEPETETEPTPTVPDPLPWIGQVVSSLGEADGREAVA